MVRCAISMSVGPGEGEINRLVDTLDSAWHYEPALVQVVLVNDDVTRPDLAARLTPPAHCAVTVIPHPRLGRGEYWWGGRGVGTFAGLGAVWPDCDFVLKMDTDSLIIAPFAERVLRCLQARPTAGVIGGHRPAFSQSHPVHWEIRKMRQVLWLGRKPRWRFQQALWGPHAFIRRAVERAFTNGYLVGEHCQGGGYVVPRAALDCLRQQGFLDNALAWLDANVAEDMCLGIAMRATGLDLCDAMEEGEPFGVEWLHLPASPEELIAQGRAIIHSVKTDETRTEEETRAFFRARRAADGAATLN